MSTQRPLEEDPPRLWVEASAFGRTRLYGGAELPWDDAAELPAFHRRLEELLEPAVVTVPPADLYATWWDAAPGDLSAAPGRDRPGAALKAMLTAPGPVEALKGHLSAIGDRRPVTLEIPAPSAWATWAAQRAGQAAGEPIGYVLVGGPDGVDAAELSWTLAGDRRPGEDDLLVTAIVGLGFLKAWAVGRWFMELHRARPVVRRAFEAWVVGSFVVVVAVQQMG